MDRTDPSGSETPTFEPLVYRREWLPPNGWWRKEVALREAGRHEEADRYHAAMVADHDDE